MSAEQRVVADIEELQNKLTLVDGKYTFTYEDGATLPIKGSNGSSFTYSSDSTGLTIVNKDGSIENDLPEGKYDITVNVSYNNGENGFSDSLTITIIVPAKPGWNLVTSVSDLKVGDKIIIACNNKGVTAGSLADTYLVNISSEFNENKSKIVGLSSDTLIFTLDGSTDAWIFKNADDELLGAISKGELGWSNGTTTWKISISEDGSAIITSNTDTYGTLQYNSSSPRFTTYTSQQTAISIYKYTAPSASSYTVTFNSNGGTSVTSQLFNEEFRCVLEPENPTKDDYEFKGWYTDEACTNEYNFKTYVSSSFTLYAKWEEKNLNNNIIAFKNNTSTSTTDLTTDNLKNEISSGVNFISKVDKVSKVYSGTDGLKFGSSSAKGELQITLTQSVKKIMLIFTAYSSDNATVTINGTAVQSGTELVFDTATTQITITTTTSKKARFYLSQIVFYTE